VGVFVRANLEAILGISLPPPSTDQGGPDGQDNGPPTCGICYQLEAITSQGMSTLQSMLILVELLPSHYILTDPYYL
jgi:hypothetical protein